MIPHDWFYVSYLSSFFRFLSRRVKLSTGTWRRLCSLLFPESLFFASFKVIFICSSFLASLHGLSLCVVVVLLWFTYHFIRDFVIVNDLDIIVVLGRVATEDPVRVDSLKLFVSLVYINRVAQIHALFTKLHLPIRMLLLKELELMLETGFKLLKLTLSSDLCFCEVSSVNQMV